MGVKKKKISNLSINEIENKSLEELIYFTEWQPEKFQKAREDGLLDDPKQVSKKEKEEAEKKEEIVKTAKSQQAGSSLPSNDAYWVSSRGKIYQLDTVGSSDSPEEHHISFIVNNHNLFGYSFEELQEAFDKYDERELMYKDGGRREGKARDEIVRKAIKDGWIRIRRYLDRRRQMLGYSINISAETIAQVPKNQQKALRNWANWIMKQAPGREKDMIIFDFIGHQETTTLKELSLFYFPEIYSKKNIFDIYLEKIK